MEGPLTPELEQEALKLTGEVIENALKVVSLERQHNLENIPLDYEDFAQIVTENIEWISCEKFTPEIGAKQIKEYVSTWRRDDSWLYCIDYMEETESDFDIHHQYRVRWSIPTRRKPIPRATACVYFTITLSKIKPKNLPVEVHFVFEGNRLVHRPGKTRFRETWLKHIIDSKLVMMENVTF